MLIRLIRIPAPISYNDALELQRAHGAELEQETRRLATLLLLQHTPVFTLGRRTAKEHLPLNTDELAARTGAEVVMSDRAGSVTYHGPGQLTAYMLLNLKVWGLNVHQHLSMLENAALQTLEAFGIAGYREPGMTGVWAGPAGAREKVCAIGISARRWVTYHGLSLNVDQDLAPFDSIIPCGLKDRRATSVAAILKRRVEIAAVETAMQQAFSRVYGAPLQASAPKFTHPMA